jgi:hypothetical protein
VSLNDALDTLEGLETLDANKSRDFIFAKNKFEKSEFENISEGFASLKAELVSERFQNLLSNITNEDVFVDANFHGGGLHQGGEGSFLNMHVDFNYHPLEKDWFRNLNILIYLNRDWKTEYGGELKLRNGKLKGSRPIEVEPIFNRAVIMETRDFTFHGYDPIAFPPGAYRRSIAAYAYTKKERTEALRTTIWYPENEEILKKVLGKNMPALIKIKSFFLGSGTSKNK